MAKSPDDSKPPRSRTGRQVSADEQALWTYVTEDVERISQSQTPPMAAPQSLTLSSQHPSPNTLKDTSANTAVSGALNPPQTQPFIAKDALSARLRSSTLAAPPHSAPPELDLRTETRLRKGKIPIEAVIDLHGMSQPEAHATLIRFITDSHAAQKRCVLVITGKGGDRLGDPFPSSYTGVLKQRLPQWLAQMPLAPLVLRTHSARKQHGGEGAYYVYLKRHRE